MTGLIRDIAKQTNTSDKRKSIEEFQKNFIKTVKKKKK
jgi:hypothetical protein